MKTIVIEQESGGDKIYYISFTGHYPHIDECFKAEDKEEAFRIRDMINRFYHHSYGYDDGEDQL